jgi:hypothetical protein
VSNTWVQVANFPPGNREGGVGFSVNGNGYFGTGNDQTSGYFSDLWEYAHDATTAPELQKNICARLFPNPLHSCATLTIDNLQNDLRFSIFDVAGKKLREQKIESVTTIIQREDLPVGIYFYRITSNEKQLSSGKLIIE